MRPDTTEAGPRAHGNRPNADASTSTTNGAIVTRHPRHDRADA